MILDWQELAALSVVLVALAYLARLGLSAVTARGSATGGGCGSGCGSCPSGSVPDASANGRGGPLVSIGPPPVPPRRDE